MNKTNEKRNKNRGIIHGDENKNDGYNGNDERNINLDCPASNLGNRDVHNSPQTVVTNQEKFRPHKVAPTGIFPDWTTGCVSPAYQSSVVCTRSLGQGCKWTVPPIS